MTQAAPPYRVIVVDDSAIVRGLLTRHLTEKPNIEVIATAANGKMAIQQCEKHDPDVILLDIEMPVMDGLTAIPHLREAAPDARILMASTLTKRNADISLQAIELGASDYIPKPSSKGDSDEVRDFHHELMEKTLVLGAAARRAKGQPVPDREPVKEKTAESGLSGGRAEAAALATPPVPEPEEQFQLRPFPSPTPVIEALVIGASTGGPQALMTLFKELKGKLTHIPIFLTQHMPPTFTSILAEHLTKASGRDCGEGRDGQVVKPGELYIAPGDYHMVLKKTEGQVKLALNQEAPENFCRPAVDPLLRSASEVYGNKALVTILTGMGQDGLEGCRPLAEKQAVILAQDEKSSVVWGMPRAVAMHNLCNALVPIEKMADEIIRISEAGRS